MTGRRKTFYSKLFFAFLVLFSLFIHVLALRYGGHLGALLQQTPDNSKIRVQFQKKDSKRLDKDKDDERQIVETRLPKTEEPPPEAAALGAQDHRAKKETRLKKNSMRPVAQDPTAASPSQASQKEKPSPSDKAAEPRPSLKNVLAQKKSYEHLLASTSDAISNAQLEKGFSDYLSEQYESGDSIDINTREYRYLGYFTGLRKAIELVWAYPRDAARQGIHGSVKVKFTIEESGKVSEILVVESSGYNILDVAIVDAISSAAPFAPLPRGFGKDRLVIRGNFVYNLYY